MAKPKDLTAPTMAPDKLAEFDQLIRDGVSPEKIAEISGASVEDVRRRAGALANGSADEDDDDLASREEMILRREAALARREAALVERERARGRNRAAGPVVQVTRVFDAVTRDIEGRQQNHRFVPSIFRGEMAERVLEIAQETDNDDCVEVLTQG